MRGLLVALILTLTLTPTLTLACWNEVRLSSDNEVKSIALIEATLQRGEAVKALKALRALYGKQAIMRPDRISTDPALGQKAWGLVAIVTVRAHRYDPKTGRPATKNRQRQVRRMATTALGRLARLKPDDPLRKARYAEALAGDPKQASKARDMLESLATADLIGEADAWIALARLRAAAGKPESAEGALKRCVSYTTPARCVLPPAAIR
ncbi:MAG: hypothetical protein ACI9U2_005031 [Bradymonadia bacterium]|jgi:hypothetical protein